MTIPSPQEFRHWLRRLLPSLGGFTILGLLAPAATAGAVLVAFIAGFIVKNPFAGIGLAALTLPFGAWLVEHPSPLRLLGCLAVSIAILWWYRRELRSAF